jgi:hypothetical protein
LGTGEELLHMRASGALPRARVRVTAGGPGSIPKGGAPADVAHGTNVMTFAYNPHGGTCVQLAWQRYSNSPRSRRGAWPCVHPADPAARALPAACR